MARAIFRCLPLSLVEFVTAWAACRFELSCSELVSDSINRYGALGRKTQAHDVPSS